MDPLLTPSLSLSLPLETVTGGSTTVAVAVFLGRALAFVLACWIAVRAYRGYQQARAPALVWLAIGIAMLAAAPTAIRFLLPTLLSTSSLTTALVATSAELTGLAAILYAVYGDP